MSLVRGESVPENDADPRRESLTLLDVWKRADAAVNAVTSVHQELVSLRGDTDEAIGRLFAEHHETAQNVAKIVAHLGLVPADRVTPQSGFRREKYQSFSDLEEEISPEGIRTVRGTESQLHSVVEHKVREVLKQRDREDAFEMVKTTKTAAGRILLALAISFFTGTAALIFAAIKGWFRGKGSP
jgi:hypothetical protein